MQPSLSKYKLFILDTYIQKAKKIYTDSRGRRNLSALNTELHDVQRIMVQNIDDVLQRGVVMDGKFFWCYRKTVVSPYIPLNL